MHIQHPCLKPGKVDFRGYQANLARIAVDNDTLIVLPTGMGKTVVGLLLVADFLKKGCENVLLMAPTKPLAEQHAAFLRDKLADEYADSVQCLTGHLGPAKREAAYKVGGIICATPQVIQNDILRNSFDISKTEVVIFDECHRAVGDYAYKFIGQELLRSSGKNRRLGLTASPGYDLEKIQEVRANLGLEHVEIRTPQDADVAEFVQQVDIDWEIMPMPPVMARVSNRLRQALKLRLRDLKELGVLATASERASRRTLLEAGRKLQQHTKRSDVPAEIYQGLSVHAQAMKLMHAIELAETQGAIPFGAFVEKMRQEAKSTKSSKATKVLLDDSLFNEAYHISRHDNHENPKLGRTEALVREQLKKNPTSKILVFANYRSTVESIAAFLADVQNVKPVVFVGQGSRGGAKGLNQKAQQKVVQEFRDGKHNVVVATSVAEEGLDIPQTDLVIFYEPIPSEIRAIQRRGRTGRQQSGKVVVLMTKGTQDEGAHWTAKRKEQEMVETLQKMRRELKTKPPSKPMAQQLLTNQESTREPKNRKVGLLEEEQSTYPIPANGPKIIVDHREQSGGVLTQLHSLGANISLETLEVGDFILSQRVAVERKRCDDFIHSILDQRLFAQLSQLQAAYAKPLLILEGESIWGHANVRPESVMGAMASITVDMGIPVIHCMDSDETARLLMAVARREQDLVGGTATIRGSRKSMGDAERLLHILAGFPDIDATRARKLLKHFGSLKIIFDASSEDLREVPGIGPEIAAKIHRLLRLEQLSKTL